MKSAHWIQKTHLFKADEFFCSACGAKAYKAYRLCPACGLPMRKTIYKASWADEAEEVSALLDNDW